MKVILLFLMINFFSLSMGEEIRELDLNELIARGEIQSNPVLSVEKNNCLKNSLI